MSINLNIEKYGGKSVVPVTCGSSMGTAFYIGENRFLTAWHVVAEAESQEQPISLLIEGVTKYCRLNKLEDMDVALLTCENELPDIRPIGLLKTNFREDEFEIIGYPQELGNGIDYFGVRVKNLKELKDYKKGFDVMVLRTDPFGFHSYSGFSGAPVLNQKGVAVGVVTDQMYNTLGYTSIKSISNKLREKHISYLEDADRYDMRDVGIGVCEDLATKACLKMKSRYNRENHVDDVALETRLQVFCGYETDRWAKVFRNEMIKWYKDVGPTIKAAVNKLTKLKTYMESNDVNIKDVANDIEFLLNTRESKNSNKYFIVGHFRDRLREISKLMDEAQSAENLENERFMYIHGDAGCGKTQHMCYFTQKISQYRNVYLLFGTDFELGKEPAQSIREALGWDNELMFASLNKEMEHRCRYATFIIDALNEGEGTFIWNTLLPALKADLEQYPRLKLIVTVRTMDPGDKLNEQFKCGWVKTEINGFSNIRKAIEKYFRSTPIYDDVEDYLYVKEFQHPLLLKIFCQVYHQLSVKQRKDIDILILYDLYYKSKNEEVSRLADEDPEQQVTTRVMKLFGDLSLQKYQCCDVPREEVINLANKICPNRLWSKNLYHALVKSNLMMEYKLNNVLKTTFQYDSMGDYMRAMSMLQAYKTEIELLQAVVELTQKINDTRINYNVRMHISNTIKTLLSIWNPTVEIWQRTEFNNGVLTQLMLESLEMRNLKSKKSTLPENMLENLIIYNDYFISPEYLLANFALYRDLLMEPVHNKLLKMKMLDRDEKWTLNVNKMHDDYSYLFKISQMELESNEKNARAYIRLLCWMTAASHPQLRNLLRRVVASWLREFSQLSKELIEKFYLCDDPYILRSVYSAVYGVLLAKRDKNLAHEVAETVYKSLYENQVHVPTEIEVRSWTLKILELNHILNPGDAYWDGAKPPYYRKDNLMEIPAGENFEDESYFGNGNGAKKLHRSLFYWDFNRYIIGTNSRNESTTYFKDGKPVNLGDITRAIAYRIKSVYRYSQALSDYDDGVRWEERVHRQTERMGKKYQWIAFGEVNAYLSDTCQMKKDWWSNKPPVETPFPWYDSNTVTFEPTLMLNGNRSYLDQDFFEEITDEDLMAGEAHEWLKNKGRVPKPIIIVKDKEQKDWVNIVGYQKNEKSENEDERETFVFICPCLVRSEDADAFENWAKEQCFYGRWMPEDSGHYEYFWNEFPWSDSYKSLDLEEELGIWGKGIEAPCKVMLPYASQLQEYYEGIDDDEEYEGTIYMPSAKMFDFFGWHTAERGVTRDKEGNVVSMCRNLQGDILDTLVIRRELLNKYLEDMGLVLFYCMLAEKRLSQEPLQRLSCCLKYDTKSDPIIVQPMTYEEDFPKSEPVEKEDMIDIIPPTIWSQTNQDGGSDVLANLFHNYDKMIEDRKKYEKNNNENE